MNAIGKGVIAGCVSIAAALSLCACGSSANNSESSTVSFQTWNLKNDTYTPYFTKLISEFEKENPGVKVKWVDQPAENYDSKLSTDAAAGQLPDIVNVNEQQAYNLAKSGALLNLSKEAAGMAKDYLPQVWDGSKFSGNGIDEGVYGFPWYLNIDVAYLNKDVFANCGLDINKPPKTYNDLFNQANTVNEKCGGKSYMIAVPYVFPSQFEEYGVNFLSKDRSKFTFNSSKGVEYIQHYADLYKKGAIPKDGMNANIINAEKLYFQGNIAYMLDSTSSVAAFKANAPQVYKQLDVAPLATNKKNTLNPMLMAVNSQTKNKKMALKLANFLTNKKNQVEFSKKSNTYPSAAGAMDDPFFKSIDESTIEGKVLRVAKEEIDNGTVANFPPEISDTDGVNYLSPELTQAIQGEKGVKEALDKAVAALNDRLK